jgi:hypothetical protein
VSVILSEAKDLLLSNRKQILRRFVPQDDNIKKIIARKFLVPYFAQRLRMAFVLRPHLNEQNATHLEVDSFWRTIADDQLRLDDAHRVRVQPKT